MRTQAALESIQGVGCKEPEIPHPETRQSVCARIGLEHVNVLKCGWKAFKSLDTLDKMLEFAKAKPPWGTNAKGWCSNQWTVIIVSNASTTNIF